MTRKVFIYNIHLHDLRIEMRKIFLEWNYLLVTIHLKKE